MNCQPNDLCQVIKLIPIADTKGNSAKLDIRGSVVKVLTIVANDGWIWEVEEKRQYSLFVGGKVWFFDLLGIGDEFLKPFPKLEEDDKIIDEAIA